MVLRRGEGVALPGEIGRPQAHGGRSRKLCWRPEKDKAGASGGLAPWLPAAPYGGLRRAAALLQRDGGLTLIEVLVALVILAVAVIPLIDALSQSLTTGEQAGRESLMVYLAQGKMEQYLQWFRQYGGRGDVLGTALRQDGVDLNPNDGSDPEPQPFPDYPGYTYRASLSPAWDGIQALRVLRVEVTGPEGRQVVLTTLVW